MKIEWTLKGSQDKPILTELHKNEIENSPIVIFAHGYKGYKDWGAWNLMVPHFLKAGFHFLKFNFSHNGGTIEQPIDFPDLETFSKNTYSKEINDLKIVIDHIYAECIHLPPNLPIYLIGHSRGGGVCILHAARDNRVKKLVTWAAISDICKRFPKGEKLNQWLKNGVRYEVNKRTQQEMPILRHLYDDAIKNKKKLDISIAAANISIPWCIIHGKEDDAVSVDEAYHLLNQYPEAKLLILENTGHTFNTYHPFTEKELNPPFFSVVMETILFLMQKQSVK